MAWARTEPWRRALAALWPGVADASRLTVRGPRADGLLLAQWLGARLASRVELDCREAEAIEEVQVDGAPVDADQSPPATPSALLSEQIEIYGRDRIYEEAVRALT